MNGWQILNYLITYEWPTFTPQEIDKENQTQLNSPVPGRMQLGSKGRYGPVANQSVPQAEPTQRGKRAQPAVLVSREAPPG